MFQKHQDSHDICQRFKVQKVSGYLNAQYFSWRHEQSHWVVTAPRLRHAEAQTQVTN